MQMENVAQMVDRACCKLRRIRKFDPIEIRQWRSPFWGPLVKETQRKQPSLNILLLDTYHELGKRKYNFNINGRTICYKAWYMALGISRTC